MGYTKTCRVLIENGDADDHVPQESVDEWKREMDSQGINWRFNNHSKTPHGWALAPGVWSTEYVEVSDRRSTMSMLSHFAEAWPDFPQYPVETNAWAQGLARASWSRRSSDGRGGRGRHRFVDEARLRYPVGA